MNMFLIILLVIIYILFIFVAYAILTYSDKRRGTDYITVNIVFSFIWPILLLATLVEIPFDYIYNKINKD